MAALFRYIGFSCIVFLVLHQIATGLQCYVCESCISASGLQIVASGASGYSCTKVTALVLNAVVSVSRGYTLTSSCTESNTVIAGTGDILNCCTTDGCNGSVTLSSSLVLAFALATAVSVLKTVMAN